MSRTENFVWASLACNSRVTAHFLDHTPAET